MLVHNRVVTDSEADTDPLIFLESICHQNLGFCGRKWVLGQTIFTNQVADGVVFKQRCVTHQPPSSSYRRPSSWGREGASSGTRSLDWWAVGGTTLSTSYRQGVHCVIHPIDAKAWFLAFSPGHHTLTYADIVIEHIDFYSSVHTHTLHRGKSMDAIYSVQDRLSLTYHANKSSHWAE